MIELLLVLFALVLGLEIGIITGLLPGIHVNLIASLILVFALAYQTISFPLAVFIVALTFTHIIIDFIPTTLLGVPSEESFLAILPAHRLVKQGRAYQAIKIAFLGILFSIPLIILATPLYVLFLPKIYILLTNVIPYALVAFSLYLILREKNVLAGLLVFLVVGILGYSAFNLPVKEPLLPLLTGLFGISSILFSLNQKENIQRQKLDEKLPKKRYFVRSLIPAFIITPLCSFFPGIGAGHISAFCAEMSKQSTRQFIFLNALVASLNMALSIVAVYTISRARSGTAAAVNSLLEPFSLLELTLLLGTCIITVIGMYFIGSPMARVAIKTYNEIPYKKIAIFTIIFVIGVNLFLTNSLGFVILAAATSLGLFAHFMKVSKIQLMGALLLPTIIYYFL